MKNKIIKFIKEKDPIYESEYDGRMEYYCFYCDKWQKDLSNPKHKKTCIYVLVKNL